MVTASGGGTGGATLSSITIVPASFAIVSGQTRQLAVLGTYSDGTTENVTSQVTWQSSNNSVATISASGLFAAVGAGTATITASIGTVTGTTSITVTAPSGGTGGGATLSSITIVPASFSIVAGQTRQLAVNGTYSDGTTQDVTSQATWQSSDNTIATVSASGLFTAVGAGTATITASIGTVTETISITVTASGGGTGGGATLTSIAIVPASFSIVTGQTRQLAVNGTYSDGTTQDVTSQATWQSSDNTIATVSTSGLLTAVGTGITTITASIGSVSGTISITVTAPTGGGGAVLSSLAIVPPSFSIAAGQNKQLAVSGVYSDGTTLDVTAQVTWNSSDPNFITLSAFGLATGVRPGSATVTATLGSKSASANGTVTSTQLHSIVVTPATASVAIGMTQAFSANGIFSDGSSTDVTMSATWGSSSTNVATIDQTGLATGVATGSATINASSASTNGSASLAVTSASLVSLDIAPDGQSIPIGGQYPLTLTGSYSDNSTQTITNATWSSSDPTLASVDAHTGIVTGVANSNGNPVTITANFGGMTNNTTVYVTSAVIESLVLTPSTASVAKGTTQQYSVNAIYSDGTIQPLSLGLTWSSSSPAIAAVDANGLATGFGVGQSTITVSLGSVATTAQLTVTSATLTSIVVTPATPTLGINGNLQFTATGVFTDGSTEDLTAQVIWRSSAANVALISNAGVATALGIGTATISANDPGGVSGSSTLTVTSARLVSIAVNPANPILPPRTRLQLTAIGVFSDGTTAPLSGVAWRTNTGKNAVVSSAGLVRSKKATNQPVPVYASLNGVTGQATLTITSMPLASLQLTPAAPTISAGTTQPFKLMGLFSDGLTTVDLSASAQWQTSSYKTAVINRSGVASGLSSGSVTITGSYGSLTPATTTLTVSSATIQSITVSPSAPIIALGTTQAFAAIGNFSDGSQQDVTSVARWTTSTPAVAVVNQGGVATSAGQGQTNVTATFRGVAGSASLTVH
jgi:uncharacterized protein YjdB